MSAGRSPPAWWYDAGREPPLAARALSGLYDQAARAATSL